MEDAPGISNKRNIGNLSELPIDVVLTLVRQRHKARKAGLHEDTRWGTPTTGLFSFATPKFLPEKPGENRLMIRQPLHQWSWGGFEGTIPKGQYGAGEVSLIERSPMVLLKNTPDHIVWTRGTTKDSPIYSMHRTKNSNWITTLRQHNEPPIVKVWKKEHFKSIPLDAVSDLIDQGAAISGKIDGAGALAYLDKDNIKVFGIRPNANGEHPDYTSVIGGLTNVKVPSELVGTLLRTELYGVRNGKPIHPTELTSILNSTLVNAIDKKQKRGINLLMAALAVNKNGVDDYRADVGSIVRKLNTPIIHEWPTYTGVQAKRVLEAIKSNTYIPTKEGVVVFPEGKRPLKAKNISDYDVVIRDIFPAETKGEPRAGGFTYSYPGSDKVVGRVGTGFSHAMLKDMLANPQNYIGQTARVHSQEQLGSGALRAPGFLAIKAD